jgi:dTDP-4-dehydrorhamnose reductase
MAVDHPPHILLLGRDGQVGHELIASLAPLGRVTALGRGDVDLSNESALRSVLREQRATAIVNAAAYTAVDKAETETELAFAVNARAPGVLAEEAARSGACLVHYSTDYVFNGEKVGAYSETDLPNPVSAYGRSKLEGEVAIAAACQRSLVFRTSWVFGAHGNNFLKTMLRLAAERDRLRVVADQVGAPTSAALIARVTSTILASMLREPRESPRWGLYHLAADGETSWHAYASYVLQRASELGASLKAAASAIEAIATSEYPTAARRPANSRLATRKLREAFSVELPHWKTGVDEVLGILMSGRSA